MYLLYLDDYHLDDLLYVPSLAQKMGRMRRERPQCLFVHGGAGQAARLLEAEGHFPERKDGLFQVQTVEEAALVERAVRQVNRRIVGALTEEGVHAVGFQGADRGLLRLDENGGVSAGRVAWLGALIEKRAVPVVSTMVQGAIPGRVHPVTGQAAALALARALGGSEVVVVFFTRNNEPGVREEGAILPVVSMDAVPESIVPDPDALHAVVGNAVPALLTSATGLCSEDTPQGTMIIPVKTPQKD